MNIKKLLLAFSLCLVIVLALFAYEEGIFTTSLRSEDLYGSWVTSVPTADRIEQALHQFGIAYDVPDDLQMTYEFCYKEDGTVTVCVENESAKEIVAVQIEAFRTGLPELLYSQYQEEANLSREETDAMLAAEGLTMETLVEMSLAQLDLENQVTSESTIITQYYCIKDGILCYASTSVDLDSGNYDMTVEPHITGDTMVLSNAADSEGNPYEGSGIVKYPLTLTRK